MLRVPSKLTLAGVAPLLCAGITTYSPMRRWKVGKDKKVGVVGLGGLGHMAVKFGRAWDRTWWSSRHPRTRKKMRFASGRTKLSFPQCR